MKKLIIVLAIVLAFVASFVYSDVGKRKTETNNNNNKTTNENVVGKCPRTLIVGDAKDCLICHVEGKSFEVKETREDDKYQYPNLYTKIRGNIGYFTVKDIGDSFSDDLVGFFDYMDKHNINHVVLEIQSPGGSLFEAWRAVGKMRGWERAKADRIVETRVYGFAASAGFLIAVSGTVGYRFASPTAELMWHELLSFSMFHIATPSSSEQETRTLRHLQDTANEWLASRSKVTKEQLDQMVKNKEFWGNGRQCVEKYGFMDALLDK